MLTIFTHCKPFQGHIATIQRNAIGSWTQLRPSCEILLFGDREGTADVAKEFGILHGPEVAKNQYDAPLLNDLLEQAERLAKHDLLCYVNCDIILGDDFIKAVEKVSRWRQRFLIVGECWDLDLTKSLNFDNPDWREALRGLVLRRGQRRGPYAIDYFVFPRRFYQQLPPFALGRAAFDNWLIWKARAQKAAVVDATQAVLAIHQNHDYAHVPGGKSEVREGEQGKLNLELAGGWRHLAFIFDATHSLKQSRIKWSFRGYFRRRMLEFSWPVLDLTRPIRHPLGLRLANWHRLKTRLARHA